MNTEPKLRASGKKPKASSSKCSILSLEPSQRSTTNSPELRRCLSVFASNATPSSRFSGNLYPGSEISFSVTPIAAQPYDWPIARASITRTFPGFIRPTKTTGRPCPWHRTPGGSDPLSAHVQIPPQSSTSPRSASRRGRTSIRLSQDRQGQGRRHGLPKRLSLPVGRIAPRSEMAQAWFPLRRFVCPQRVEARRIARDAPARHKAHGGVASFLR
jgi:hypothetical protein